MTTEDALKNSRQFIHDWLREDSDELACSRDLFEVVLADAFMIYAGATDDDRMEIDALFADKYKSGRGCYSSAAGGISTSTPPTLT